MPARPFLCSLATAVACATNSLAAAAEPAFDRPLAEMTELAGARGVAVDDADRVYITESYRDRVSVFDRDGRPLATWGDVDAMLDRPTGIAIGPDGHVYVADTDHHRVAVFTRDGQAVRHWGGRGAEAGMFSFPEGIDVDERFVYVADTGNGRVQVFDHDGAFRHIMATGIHHDDALYRPVDVAAGESGYVYVADADRDTIHAFDEHQRPAHFGEWGSFPGLLAEPRGMTVHEELLLVADSRNDRVQVFRRPSRPGVADPAFSWGRASERDDHLRDPIDVAVAPSGAFAVVLEREPRRARIFAPAGTPAPQTRKPPRLSRFGTLLAADGDLLVLHDEATATLAVFAQSDDGPERIADLGGRGRKAGRLIRPTAVAINAATGDVTVTDAGNARLVHFRVQRDRDAPPAYDHLGGVFVKSVDLNARLGADLRDLRWPPGADGLVRGRDRWYVLDTRNARILVLDDELQLADVWDGGGLTRPIRLALDSGRGRLFVADAGDHLVHVLHLDGTRAATWSVPTFAPTRQEAAGLALDADGALHVIDASTRQRIVFDADGGATPSGDLGLQVPGGIAIDASGRSLIVDRSLQACIVIDEAGAPDVYLVPWAQRPRAPADLPGDSATAGDDGWREITSNGGTYLVRWRPDVDPVPLNDDFAVEFQVFDATEVETPLSRVRAVVDGAMPHHRHGMIQRAVMQRPSRSTLTATGMRFHMPGRWELYFDIERDGITDRAQAVVLVE